MTELPIVTPRPAAQETVYSYLSRVAASWQADVPELAYDMGAPFQRFLNHDPDAFETLAEWANLEPTDMDELLSWTGVRAGNVRMEFRNEPFVSRALRNPVMRGCPVCLREDARNSDQPAAASMVMRGGWLMREANICIRHAHPLVELWTCAAPRDRFNIAARLKDIENDIVAGTLDQPSVAPTAYDMWLEARLQDGRDETWFKGHSLFAATTFCRLLGQALLQGKGEHDPGNPPHSAGFALAEMGELTLREELGKIATSCDAEPYKAYRVLFVALNREYAEHEDFEVYRRILRDVIQDRWPIGAGEELLGEKFFERRMHSLKTASQEIGIVPKVIERFLVEAGALSPDDARAPGHRVFDAKAHTSLLAEIPTLVGPIAMREAIGATRQELAALEREGVLRPRTRVS